MDTVQTATIRIEHDLLGAKEVPVDCYYGIHTLRAIENFKISSQKVGTNSYFIRALAQVKKASAQANLNFGKLTEDQSLAIQRACDVLIHETEKWQGSFPIDVYQGGAGTSINMNTNEVIANIALESLGHQKGQYDVIHPNDHVNKSQSTNDVYPTAIRLSTYCSLDALFGQMDNLITSFENKAIEFRYILKMGRTQLQDAVPMTLGQEFHAFATLLKEDVRLIKRTRELLLEVNLGATAIGTGVNTPKGYAVKVISCFKEISGLNLVGEIQLPELQAGSSIMPAKVNPVIPEVVNQIAFKVIGNDLTITFAAEAGQLQLNVMEPVIAISLNESIELLTHAIQSLDEKCVRGIKAHEQACHDAVMRSVGIITLLDPLLGHALCDEIGKQCIAENKTIQEVFLERGLLTQAQLGEIFSFENLVSEVNI